MTPHYCQAESAIPASAKGNLPRHAPPSRQHRLPRQPREKPQQLSVRPITDRTIPCSATKTRSTHPDTAATCQPPQRTWLTIPTPSHHYRLRQGATAPDISAVLNTHIPVTKPRDPHHLTLRRNAPQPPDIPTTGGLTPSAPSHLHFTPSWQRHRRISPDAPLPPKLPGNTNPTLCRRHETPYEPTEPTPNYCRNLGATRYHRHLLLALGSCNPRYRKLQMVRRHLLRLHGWTRRSHWEVSSMAF